MKFTHTKLLAGLMALALSFSLVGCGAAAQSGSGAETPSAAVTGTAAPAAALASAMPATVTQTAVSDPELTGYEAQGSFSVTAADGGSVTRSGSVWTIRSAGTYTVTGALENGQLVVDAGDEDVVELVLNNASITCADGAPILILNADDVKIKAEEDSYNTVTDGRSGSAENEEYDAAIWSDCDLNLRGKGTLIVTSSYAKGVKSTDDLSVKNLTLKVSAADTALRGKDSVTVESGTLLLLSDSGDGINSDVDVLIQDGAVTISVGDDGIHADGVLTIAGGAVRVEQSHEGLEANVINIDGGSTYVYGTDDGVNARRGDVLTLISVTGGYLEVVTPAGDTDAIDSNGNFSMTGGFVLIRGGAGMGGMAGSMDCDGSVSVTGGSIVALGGVCSVPGSGSVCTWISSGSSLTAGDYTLTDSKGNEILSFTLDGSYSGVWIASDAMEIGGSYTLRRDGSEAASWTQSAATEGSALFGGMGGFGGKGGMGGFGGPADGGQSRMSGENGRTGGFPAQGGMGRPDTNGGMARPGDMPLTDGTQQSA